MAHPETNGYVTPYSLEERLLHVKEAERRLRSAIPWLCDTMANDAKHALGNAPNSEFIIDPEGRIAVRRSWSNPAELRRDLERLVGPVDQPTDVADLDWNIIPPPKSVATGIVPRVSVPGHMKPLVIEPQASAQPFYAKLRVEVEETVLRGGAGKMYLGFHLDPLYDVHWNNLAAPLRFELTSPAGVRLSPARGQGPRVEQDADFDPREFLIGVQDAAAGATVYLAVWYFACNDAQGWCKPVHQEYEICFRPDADAGSVRQRSGPERALRKPLPGVKRRPPGLGPGGPPPGAPRGSFSPGLILGVDAEQAVLAIRTRDRGPLRCRVTDATVMTSGGARIALSDLRPPQRAMFELADSSDLEALPVLRRLRVEVMAPGTE